jgi:hypothetical protein
MQPPVSSQIPKRRLAINMDGLYHSMISFTIRISHIIARELPQPW